MEDIVNNLIIEIMDTCGEAIKYIENLIKKNNIVEAIELLVTLRELIYKVLNQLKENNNITDFSEKYCNNIICSIDKILLQNKNIVLANNSLISINSDNIAKNGNLVKIK